MIFFEWLSAASTGAAGGHCVGAGQRTGGSEGETTGSQTGHTGVEVQVRGHSEAQRGGEGAVRVQWRCGSNVGLSVERIWVRMFLLPFLWQLSSSSSLGCIHEYLARDRGEFVNE